MTERDKKSLAMLGKGQKVTALLPGWRLLGVDQGYLLTREKGYGSINLPEDVVDTILELAGHEEEKGSCSCPCHSESSFCEECCDGGPRRAVLTSKGGE